MYRLATQTHQKANEERELETQDITAYRLLISLTNAVTPLHDVTELLTLQIIEIVL